MQPSISRPDNIAPVVTDTAPQPWNHVFRWLVALLGAATLFLALYQLPSFGDWDHHFYPMAQADQPYEHWNYNPPWVHAVLRPFRLLPVHAAGALWVTLSIVIIIYASHRLGADRLGLALTLSSPALWFFITLGQLDALLLLGFVVSNRPWDVLLLAIKPQVIGVAILFKLRDYDRKALLQLGAFLLISLLIWWNWPSVMVDRWIRGGGHQPLSLDVFPWGVPAGLILLWIAWRRRNVVLGALASYFLTPYVGPGSHIVYAALIFSTAPTPARLGAYAAYWLFVLNWVN